MKSTHSLTSTQRSILRGFIEGQPELVKGQGDTFQSAIEEAISRLNEIEALSSLIGQVLDAIDVASKGKFTQWRPSYRRKWVEQWAASATKGVRDLVWLLTSWISLQFYSTPVGRKLVWHEGSESADCVASPESEEAHRPTDVRRKFSVCIIGSGAGGAVVAQRLAEAGIKDVLIVEAGSWLNPGDFPFHDDATALHRAYVSHGVQPALSKPIPIDEFLKTGSIGIVNVLQGGVVGGGPAVNNAICLRMPKPSDRPEPWRAWQESDVPFDYDDLVTAYDGIEDDLKPREADVDVLAGWRSKILKSDHDPEPWQNLAISVVRGCLACGGCNTGCRYGKKKGGLHPWRSGEPNSHLMRALRHPTHPAKLLAQHRAEKFVIENGRARAVVVRNVTSLEKVCVEADAFVLAAGPFASTVVLSNTTLPLSLPNLGKRLSANLITAVYGVIPDPPPDSKRPRLGLQMCYVVGEEGMLLRESWFAFPGAIAASLPGGVATRRQILQHYEELGCVGVVVPTAPHGEVYRDPVLGVQRIMIGPDGNELARFKQGVIEAARALIDVGATSVCLASKELIQAKRLSDFKRLVERKIKIAADLNLGTSHPQGGNAISNDAHRGVVDASFQVRGVSGLFVADASLFPAGCGVNPMLTVMALASMAARRVVEHLPNVRRG